MGRHGLAAMVLAIGLLTPALAHARFTFQAGDNVYADGQWFTAEEYEEYKKAYPDTPKHAQQPPPQYQYQYQPQYQAPPYVPQVQAPPTTTMVNGRPVITVAPPAVSAPLSIDPGTSVAAMPPRAPYPYAPSYAAAPALRAATCRTVRAYDEFPADTEKFDCGAAGQLTRPEMMAQGWKIDFVEKVQPAGYKVILSR